MANGGIKMDAADMTVEEPVSTVVTMGFAIPPVVVEDVSRNAAVFPLIAAAVPPPAIMASAQVNTGLRSPTVATITAVPAMPASGTATVSKRLSIQGM